MAALNEITDEQMYSLLQSFAEKREWHLKFAKFNKHSHQSLLAHSLNVASISLSLLEFLENKQLVQQDKQLHLQLFLTGFLHDCVKETEVYQNAVKQFLDKNGPEPLDFGHQHEKDIRSITETFKKYICKKAEFNEEILEEAIWSITHLGKRENAASISQTFKKAPSKKSLICTEIVHFSDILASKYSVEKAAHTILEGETLSKLSLTFSKVNEVRGVLTHFLHNALEEEYEKQGFKALLWFPDGTVYIGLKENTKSADMTNITEAIAKKMKQTLSESHARDMAKAAFGGLTQRVICAPEFLFMNDKTIHSFWQFILSQKFSKPNSKSDKLEEMEKKFCYALSSQLKTESKESKRIHLARFNADYNLLIVLYAVRKELIDNISDNKKEIEHETTKKINAVLAAQLDLSQESMNDWPEIALQTKTDKRIPVALSFWKSPHYTNVAIWRIKLSNALEKSTLEIAKIWRAAIPDQFEKIANMLINDITAPINPDIIVKETKELKEVTTKGKTNHGTISCQKCGGAAIIEAQAKLFGSSEIYHDNLVAGSRVGGGNKLKVCELCEFEEKLRLMLTGGNKGYTNSFYIQPQLSLSRRQQIQWQTTINKIEYNHGMTPALLRPKQWAEAILSGQELFNLDNVTYNYLSQNDKLRAINEIAEQQNLEDDLSAMICPSLDAKNGEEILALLNEGKTKLTEDYQREVDKVLNQIEPLYISPNFILLLTRGTVASKEEQVSVTEIKWTYLRFLLARMFHANVQSETSINLNHSLGYTTLPTYLNLRPLSEKLGAKNGWIAIPNIEDVIKKLSALILIDKELSVIKADYGKATLLRLLNEEPGRVLNRAMVRHKGPLSKKLINSVEVWYCR